MKVNVTAWTESIPSKISGSKYDSTAKGGVAITIGKELNIPIAYVCDGEKYEDIRKFDAEKYLNEFVGY